MITSFSRKTDTTIVSGVVENIPVPIFSSIGELLIFDASSSDPLDDGITIASRDLAQYIPYIPYEQ